ncbi:uncharacterized protein LOC125369779 [Ricinus communis]|uniref:uncharacterized protein LOC125369779 n=1 Tax=Ricinus communis TaxID=3988 RepID=UPI00201AD6C7|nr:uncharacterized protein LOC125369779 [Ricinus communis]
MPVHVANISCEFCDGPHYSVNCTVGGMFASSSSTFPFVSIVSSNVEQDEPAKEGPEPEVVEIERKKEDRQKSPVRVYQPPVSYPTRLRQDKVDKQYRLHESKPTRMSIQLADRTVKIPRGVVEHVALAENEEELSNEQVLEQLAILLASELSLSTDSYLFLDKYGVQKVKTSFEDPPVLELKELPSHLIYAFLGEEKRLPVIIAADLTPEEQAMLLEVIRKYKKAFAFKIADIPGINPSFYFHKISLEDSFRPVVQPQRRLNPNMKEVVKKEVIKLLDTGLIYPMSNSSWVSPVQVVPKKGGMMVVRNEKDELIPTRMVTGFRVCIDYRRLNDATRKDHFPLPFIDKMIERLVGHMFYCYLDGFSGYFRFLLHLRTKRRLLSPAPIREGA